MLEPLRIVVDRLLEAQTVEASSIEAAFAAIMDGQCSDAEIATLLTALRCRGEEVSHVVGAARAMRARSLKTPSKQRGLLDTCGTGGDGSRTFNISTAAAFVAAAAGVPVAKHGNRSATSLTGSADVLEALGASLQLTPEQVGQCIDEIGIGFCFAQKAHGSMKHAAPVRQKLGFRTIFNLLGPLTNPAGAEHQIIGTGRIVTAELLASALQQLGTRKSLVVCGNDELDEICLWGTTAVFVVTEQGIARQNWTPGDLGLPPCRLDDLRVSSSAESAEVIRHVFEGATGPARDMVLANAAGALVAAERAATPAEGVKLADEAISSGAANRLLLKFVERTQSLIAASPS